MPTIAVRKLDPTTWEPLYGNGQANFIYDADAVAQIVATRLRLFQGEWWEDLTIGTPMFQKILGVPGAGRQTEAISAILQQRIKGSPYITGIQSISISWNPETRNLSFSAKATSQFGLIGVSFGPGITVAPLNS